MSDKRQKIVIVNGPNINLVGEREVGVYGKERYEDIMREVEEYAEKCGFCCEIFQSNGEGAIIDKLHSIRKEAAGVVINAGAYTHYSYAIRDAIAAIRIPCVEVHLSNIFDRDEFRSRTVIGPVCCGTISGFGKNSYLLAVDALKRLL